MKLIPSLLFDHPGIMSCDDHITFQSPGPLVEVGELQMTITFDTGIWGKASQIAVDKRINDLIPKIFLKVEDIIGNPQLIGHTSGIFHIIERTAGLIPAGPGLIFIKLHGHPDAIVTFHFHQISCH